MKISPGLDNMMPHAWELAVAGSKTDKSGRTQRTWNQEKTRDWGKIESEWHRKRKAEQRLCVERSGQIYRRIRINMKNPNMRRLFSMSDSQQLYLSRDGLHLLWSFAALFPPIVTGCQRVEKMLTAFKSKYWQHARRMPSAMESYCSVRSEKRPQSSQQYVQYINVIL